MKTAEDDGVGQLGFNYSLHLSRLFPRAYCSKYYYSEQGQMDGWMDGPGSFSSISSSPVYGPIKGQKGASAARMECEARGLGGFLSQAQ